MEVNIANMITGRCCCGDVAFTREDKFGDFYFCHCEQCRKLTGTAHAANLLVDVRLGTLRNWEQGRREPTGPAQAFYPA